MRGTCAIVLAAGCGRIGFGAVASGDAGTEDDDAAIDVLLVSDDFQRTVATGWGSAPIGGPWLVFNPDGQAYSVNGTGNVQIATASTYTDAHVNSATARDVETAVTAAFDRLPPAGAAFDVHVIAREIATGSNYLLNGSEQADGSIEASLYVAGTQAQAAIIVLTVTAGERFALSIRATGAQPTTVCAKLWLANAMPPADCTLSLQDSTPVLESPGISFVATQVGAAPVNVSFGSFTYRRVGPM